MGSNCVDLSGYSLHFDSRPTGRKGVRRTPSNSQMVSFLASQNFVGSASSSSGHATHVIHAPLAVRRDRFPISTTQRLSRENMAPTPAYDWDQPEGSSDESSFVSRECAVMVFFRGERGNVLAQTQSGFFFLHCSRSAPNRLRWQWETLAFIRS